MPLRPSTGSRAAPPALDPTAAPIAVLKEDHELSARKKSNAAYFNGILFISGVLGLATESGVVFLLSAAVLFITSLQAEHIRPPR